MWEPWEEAAPVDIQINPIAGHVTLTYVDERGVKHDIYFEPDSWDDFVRRGNEAAAFARKQKEATHGRNT